MRAPVVRVTLAGLAADPRYWFMSGNLEALGGLPHCDVIDLGPEADEPVIVEGKP